MPLRLLAFLVLGLLLVVPSSLLVRTPQPLRAQTNRPQLFLPMTMGGAGTPSASTATATTTTTATTTIAATTTTIAQPGNQPPTKTPTNTLTNTPTKTVTSTPTKTPTSTPTKIITNTPTKTLTSTPIKTATNTPTKTPTHTPTSTQAPASPPVQGAVAVKPVFKDTSRAPIAYDIVLDASGSMVMDMYGDANMFDGRPVLCADPATFGSASKYPYEASCIASGDQQRWNTVEERRIYIAKQAIIQAINRMDPAKGDTMRIIAFSTGANSSVGNDHVEVLPADGWSSDKTVLTAAVLQAGTFNGNPYLTQGTTPTPEALQTVLQLLQSTSAPTTFNNQPYQHSVVLVTDGMANVFLDGRTNDADDIPECRAFSPHNRVYSIIDCQRGYSDAYQQPRPLDAMIAQAKAIKNFDPNLLFYVIGMAQVAPYGLEDQLPNMPSMFFRANDPQAISSAFASIQTQVTATACVPRTVDNFRTTISPTETVSGYPVGVYGYVTIKDANGNVVPGGAATPIVQDATTGNALGWSLPQGLAAGTYRLSVDVGFKGVDGIERHYTKIATNENAYADELSFTVPANTGATVVVPTLDVNFDPALDICPPIKK